MKQNKQKGIATSTIIYMVLIVFATLIFSTVSIVSTNTKVSNDVLSRVESFLGDPKGNLAAKYDGYLTLTIPAGTVSTSLEYFPLTIFLDSTNASEVFSSVGSDAKKIAIFTKNLSKQLYIEVEKWDSLNQVAVLHASESSFTISNIQDTVLYLYYGSAADNTEYVDYTPISENSSLVVNEVWNSSYSLVLHMGTAYDSSSYHNNISVVNGTTVGDGPIGYTRYFNGTSDYLTIPDNANGSLDPTNFTLLTMIQPLTVSTDQIVSKRTTSSAGAYFLYINNASSIYFDTYPSGSVRKTISHTLSLTSYTLITVKVDASYSNSYINGSVSGSALASAGTSGSTSVLRIGADTTSLQYYYKGYMDEIRLISSAKEASWIAAEYKSLSNTLITYTTN